MNEEYAAVAARFDASCLCGHPRGVHIRWPPGSDPVGGCTWYAAGDGCWCGGFTQAPADPPAGHDAEAR